jgi:hypothetical protein
MAGLVLPHRLLVKGVRQRDAVSAAVELARAG